MAEFDGRGPAGAGPMSGKGRGFCITECRGQVHSCLGSRPEMGLGRELDDRVRGRRVGRDRQGWSR